MGRALRQHRTNDRRGERIPLHAQMHVATLDGKPAAPLARCTNIGLGGIRVAAAQGLAPGTPVHIELILPPGRVFTSAGHIAWSCQTIHPSLFGAIQGRDDDALFGIAFDGSTPEDLLPISRLIAARDSQILRARRIRRIHGFRPYG